MEFDVTPVEGLTLALLFLGWIFIGIASLGILRMPDLFLRMSMTTKASTLGVGSILLACMLHFREDAGIVSRVFATIIFLFLTAPVSAHMIGRAGYIDKDTSLWHKTHIDDLKDHYTNMNVHSADSMIDREIPTADIEAIHQEKMKQAAQE